LTTFTNKIINPPISRVITHDLSGHLPITVQIRNTKLIKINVAHGYTRDARNFVTENFLNKLSMELEQLTLINATDENSTNENVIKFVNKFTESVKKIHMQTTKA